MGIPYIDVCSSVDVRCLTKSSFLPIFVNGGNNMNLCVGETLSCKPGDFGAKVTGENRKRLAVPKEIFSMLVAMRIETAEGLFKALYESGTQDLLQEKLEKALGWSVTDFMSAAFNIGLTLDGYVSDSLLYPRGGRRASNEDASESRGKRKRIRVPV